MEILELKNSIWNKILTGWLLIINSRMKMTEVSEYEDRWRENIQSDKYKVLKKKIRELQWLMGP